jgi:pyridoxal phosphate enzyme (YggS family)
MKVCPTNALKNRLEQVNDSIYRTCQESNRSSKDVTLIAVTKRQPAHLIASLFSLGVKDIGENYVQEVMQKQAALDELSGKLNWHLIGSLQRKKVKFLPGNFTMMHSLDRMSIAQELNTEFAKAGFLFPVMLQVNVSGETTKSGWLIPEGKISTVFLEDVEKILQLPSLKVCGLMTMPPLSSQPEASRPFYLSLRKIAEGLNAYFNSEIFTKFSMGTSFDFPIAIQEGATHVRIGEAILGPRVKNV